MGICILSVSGSESEVAAGLKNNDMQVETGVKGVATDAKAVTSLKPSKRPFAAGDATPSWLQAASTPM